MLIAVIAVTERIIAAKAVLNRKAVLSANNVLFINISKTAEKKILIYSKNS